jgi:hypothetical protein
MLPQLERLGERLFAAMAKAFEHAWSVDLVFLQVLLVRIFVCVAQPAVAAREDTE